jgi:hypothetical protein
MSEPTGTASPPTVMLAAADGRAYAVKVSGAYSHRVLEGIGHNVPQEAPGAFTDAILEVGGGLP